MWRERGTKKKGVKRKTYTTLFDYHIPKKNNNKKNSTSE